MDCRDCPRYDPERRRCLDGKLNPERYSQAVELARIFGLRSICPFGPHRERLVGVRSAPSRPADGSG